MGGGLALAADIVAVSSKFQVVSPKAVRNALRLHPGDQMIVAWEPGGALRLQLRPRSYSEAALGLHAEMWNQLDPVQYVRKERDAWERPQTVSPHA